MKPEINWGTKGKTSSPVLTDYDVAGYPWDQDLTLPPPPDIPDSVSVDSNTDIPALNLCLLPSADSAKGDGMIDDETCGASGGIPETSWPIPHPNEYLLPHHENESFENCKPVVRRNRYQEKSHNNNFNSDHAQELEDEINENCSLLCGPAVHPPIIHSNKPRKGMSPTAKNPSTPQKHQQSSTASTNGGTKSNNNPRKHYSKTTHITEV